MAGRPGLTRADERGGSITGHKHSSFCLVLASSDEKADELDGGTEQTKTQGSLQKSGDMASATATLVVKDENRWSQSSSTYRITVLLGRPGSDRGSHVVMDLG